MVEPGSEFERNLINGTALLRSGSINEAIPFLEAAYESESANLDASLNLGGALILAKKFRRARNILETAAINHPDEAKIWINLGAARLGNPVLADNQMREDAVEAFKEAYALEPDAPSVAYNIGLVYRDQQDYASALEWFEIAGATDSDDLDAISIARKMRERIDNSGQK